MEDQQSAAGDLTDQPVDAGGPADGEKSTADPASGTPQRRHRMPVGKARRGTAAPESPAGDTADAAPAPVGTEPDAAEPDAVPEVGTDGPAVDGTTDDGATGERRRPGRWAPAALAAAVALFVGSAAFAGATVAPYLVNRAMVDTKLDIARTAAEAITALWTYTPENMEALADRSARFLGGDFEAQYRKYVDAIAPTNRQAQVTNSTQVVGAAVESLDGPDATAIVYTNSTATSPLTKGIPSLRYLSYRLTMSRTDARWLVTSMTTITSLDLTPQI